MANTADERRARQGGDAPDVAALKSAWSSTVNDRQTNYWTRQRLNWEARYCVWPGQSSDGRKWPRNKQQKIWPWRGASDSRVPLVDKYVREDVALLMGVFQNNRILVRPNAPHLDAAWANRMTALLRWLMYDEMEETEDEAEYLANLLLERGCGALGIWWDFKEVLTRETLDMEQLVAAAAQAQQRLMQGMNGDALQFQAQLPGLLVDPTNETLAGQVLNSLLPEGDRLAEARLRKVLKSLRETGTAQFPRRIVQVNRPCLRTLAWNEDIWTPPEAGGDLQKSRQVFIRELLDESALFDRVKSYEWDADYVDEVVEKAQGRNSQLWETGVTSKRGGQWNSMGTPDTQSLYEVVTAYERLSDEDGISGIYCTTFCPHVGEKRGRKEWFAKSELMDYAHGQYPFAVWQSERRSRLIDDARGYGEVASTWQTQIKRQWDARIDRADISTLPPAHHPPGEEPDAWGPGVNLPTMQPERFGFFEIPKNDQGSKEVEETVRRFADEYFGRPVDDQNVAESRLLRQELVRKWQRGWKRATTQIMQLCQQYMPDEFFFRVVGGEQGRGIRATREEIQGPFNITLKFNVADIDTELVKEKMELFRMALEMDRNAIVDTNEAVSAAFELIDPGYGERLLRPAETATQAEVASEQEVLSQMLNGIQVDLKGNEAVALRKQVLQQLLQNNPTAHRRLQEDENVRNAVERRMKQLDFAVQQKMVNPEIGRRLGTKPNEQLNPM